MDVITITDDEEDDTLLKPTACNSTFSVSGKNQLIIPDDCSDFSSSTPVQNEYQTNNSRTTEQLSALAQTHSTTCTSVGISYNEKQQADVVGSPVSIYTTARESCGESSTDELELPNLGSDYSGSELSDEDTNVWMSDDSDSIDNFDEWTSHQSYKNDVNYPGTCFLHRSFLIKSEDIKCEPLDLDNEMNVNKNCIQQKNTPMRATVRQTVQNDNKENNCTEEENITGNNLSNGKNKISVVSKVELENKDNESEFGISSRDNLLSVQGKETGSDISDKSTFHNSGNDVGSRISVISNSTISNQSSKEIEVNFSSFTYYSPCLSPGVSGNNDTIKSKQSGTFCNEKALVNSKLTKGSEVSPIYSKSGKDTTSIINSKSSNATVLLQDFCGVLFSGVSGKEKEAIKKAGKPFDLSKLNDVVNELHQLDYCLNNEKMMPQQHNTCNTNSKDIDIEDANYNMNNNSFCATNDSDNYKQLGYLEDVSDINDTDEATSFSVNDTITKISCHKKSFDMPYDIFKVDSQTCTENHSNLLSNSPSDFSPLTAGRSVSVDHCSNASNIKHQNRSKSVDNIKSTEDCNYVVKAELPDLFSTMGAGDTEVTYSKNQSKLLSNSPSDFSPLTVGRSVSVDHCSNESKIQHKNRSKSVDNINYSEDCNYDFKAELPDLFSTMGAGDTEVTYSKYQSKLLSNSPSDFSPLTVGRSVSVDHYSNVSKIQHKNRSKSVDNIKSTDNCNYVVKAELPDLFSTMAAGDTEVTYTENPSNLLSNSPSDFSPLTVGRSVSVDHCSNASKIQHKNRSKSVDNIKCSEDCNYDFKAELPDLFPWMAAGDTEVNNGAYKVIGSVTELKTDKKSDVLCRHGRDIISNDGQCSNEHLSSNDVSDCVKPLKDQVTLSSDKIHGNSINQTHRSEKRSNNGLINEKFKTITGKNSVQQRPVDDQYHVQQSKDMMFISYPEHDKCQKCQSTSNSDSSPGDYIDKTQPFNDRADMVDEVNGEDSRMVYSDISDDESSQSYSSKNNVANALNSSGGGSNGIKPPGVMNCSNDVDPIGKSLSRHDLVKTLYDVAENVSQAENEIAACDIEHSCSDDQKLSKEKTCNDNVCVYDALQKNTTETFELIDEYETAENVFQKSELEMKQRNMNKINGHQHIFDSSEVKERKENSSNMETSQNVNLPDNNNLMKNSTVVLEEEFCECCNVQVGHNEDSKKGQYNIKSNCRTNIKSKNSLKNVSIQQAEIPRKTLNGTRSKTTKKFYKCKNCGKSVKSKSSDKISKVNSIENLPQCLNTEERCLPVEEKQSDTESAEIGVEVTEFEGYPIKENQLNSKSMDVSEKETEDKLIKKSLYTCHVCDKIFKNKTHLKFHNLLHITEHQYVCKFCCQSFLNEECLKDHMKNHSVEKPYVCCECDKCFAKFDYLKSHYLYEHTVKKSYSCIFCDKTFRKKGILIIHILKHGQRKQQCLQCSKFFFCKNDLAIHVKVHFKNLKFSCSKCDAAFMFKRNLRNHKRALHRQKKGENKMHIEALAETVKDRDKGNATGTHVDKEIQYTVCRNSEITYKYEESQLSQTEKLIEREDVENVKNNNCDMNKGLSDNDNVTDINGENMNVECYDEDDNSGHPSDDCKNEHSKKEDTENSVQNCNNNVVSTEINDAVPFDDPKLKTKPIVLLEKCTNPTNYTRKSKKKSFSCKVCGKCYNHKGHLNVHYRKHSDNPKPYKCPLCGKKFAVKQTLELHVRIHSGEKPYQCKVCSKTFRCRSNLRVHTTTHSKNRSFKCDYCERTFKTTNGLKYHNLIHSDDKKFVCHICDKRFALRFSYVVHYRSHSGEKLYSCNECGKSFSVPSALKNHFVYRHTEERPYKCTICNYKAKLPTDLNNHIKRHSAEKVYECVECGNRYLHKRGLVKHMKVHSEKKYYNCDQCSASFLFDRNLIIHVRALHRPVQQDNVNSVVELSAPVGTITSEASVLSDTANVNQVDKDKIHQIQNDLLNVIKESQSISCEAVDDFAGGKSYRDSSSHSAMVEENTEQTMVTLEVSTDKSKDCGIILANAEKLVEETVQQASSKVNASEASQDTTVHDESGNKLDQVPKTNEKNQKEKRYICSVCLKRFYRPDHLESHYRVHSKFKPFKCEFCKKAFSHKQTLDSHMRSHTGEKPYSCSECGKNFRVLSQCKVHERTHTGERPYKCELCGKCFSQEGHLKYHKLEHTGERKFKCDKCGKCFKSNSYLTQHLDRHNGERPYCCVECGKTYTDRRSLKNHHISHHTDQRPYTCKYCNRSFKLIDIMKNHIKVVHEGKAKQYQCQECDKMFDSKSKVIVHNRIHTGEKPHRCEQCGENFRLKNNLKNHIDSVHLKLPCKKYPCTVCDKEVSDLKRHMMIHTGEQPFKCSECDFRSADKNRLECHMRIHTGEKPFVCSVCGKAFRHQTTLTNHARIHTGDKKYHCSECDYKSFDRSSLIKHERIHSGVKIYVCGFEGCDKVFKTGSERNFHNKNHVALSCNFCGEKFNMVKQLSIHMKVHKSEKPYTCPVCNKSFGGKGNLKTHLTVHSDLTPYECEICGMAFKVKSALKHHNRRAHSDEPIPHNYICQEEGCNSKFRMPSGLRKHMETTHSNERPYPCKLCDKRFKTTVCLQLHMRSHTGEKPFVCKVCGKGFTQRSNLKTHQVTHSDVKKFECKDCGRMFALKYSLKSHIKIVHTVDSQYRPFKCDICETMFRSKSTLHSHKKKHGTRKILKCDKCDKTFVSGDGLRSHIRSRHTMERPYVCTYDGCEKAFGTKPSLKTHMVVHTGERPFPCPDCGKCFTQNSHMRTHQRMVHLGMRKQSQRRKKKYNCDQCGKCLSSLHAMKYHMKIHTDERPYKCEFCSMAFRTPSALKCHRRTHTGECPFKCEQCSETFSRRDYLNFHIAKEHTEDGERPFVCQVEGCDKKYFLESELKNHAKCHEEWVVSKRVVT